MAAVKARRRGGSAQKAAPPPRPISRLATIQLHAQSGRPRGQPLRQARVLLAGMVLFTGVATAGAAFFASSLYDVGNSVAAASDNLAVGVGMRVARIDAPGLDAGRLREVRAVALPEGRSSMFAADPRDVKARVESLDWVAHADVQRLWPSTVRITVHKRRAVARWQEAGSVSLIDAAGERVHAARPYEGAALPLVVGAGAGPEAEPLLRAIEELPEIRSRLRELVRVGERRWDARFAGGVTVALPADDPARALSELQRLQARYGLLDRSVARIDLRQTDLVAVTPAAAPSQDS